MYTYIHVHIYIKIAIKCHKTKPENSIKFKLTCTLLGNATVTVQFSALTKVCDISHFLGVSEDSGSSNLN